jgi:hypothetical protein
METDFLYAKPSALSGAARTLDLWALFDSYNSSLNGEQADTLALWLDWHMAGKDLWAAYDRLKEENGLDEKE